MSNVTLSIPEGLLKEGRKYAQKQNTSLNALIREVLQKLVQKKNAPNMDNYFKLVNKLRINSRGWKFNREEIYEHLK